ncbi:hypothetical protein M422DRAFT_248482 [Sphaerobolus stellatus SS14]|uniref:Arrestin-like N-terminal domain-containing protein n=1 Tax=Sphaerobolus stellatus (strain SS14) TaxID=990650 RepID=A0A0C9VIV0_SPHS4|nr:hypothetical protein M422DRAFT_248482 [Sphaerobolus stellatus SS14]
MFFIPLFKPIPIKIKVTSRSKPLPMSAANNPGSFECPRNPKVSDINLMLRSIIRLKHSKTSYAQRVMAEDLGLPDDVRKRDTWGKNVEVDISLSSWAVDKENPKKGYWSDAQLTTAMCLRLIVDFPGLGNWVKVRTLDLPLTSGIPPPDWHAPASEYSLSNIPIPPPPPFRAVVPSTSVAVSPVGNKRRDSRTPKLSLRISSFLRYPKVTYKLDRIIGLFMSWIYFLFDQNRRFIGHRMAPPVISISLPKGLRVPGERVSGILNLNIELAKEKGVDEVTVSLRGEIKTWVTTGNSGNDTNRTTERDKETLFQMTCSLWREGETIPSQEAGIASFPFAFSIPDGNLPPSFYGGTRENGGAVVYYVHAVGRRRKWYKRNIHVDEIFPCIPSDTGPSVLYSLPSWNGGWDMHQNSEKVKKGIFSHSGLVTAAIILPSMPSIPLFKPIPINLKVTCRSKSLPLSAANNPRSFEYPRNPKVSDIDFILYSRLTIKHSTQVTRVIEEEIGHQAGFGLPDGVRERDTRGKHVDIAISPPVWTIDKGDPNKGYWSEEITFSSLLFLRCPPPIRTRQLNTTMSLKLVIDFAGLGNKVKVEIPDLSLTSGLPPPGWHPPISISPVPNTPVIHHVPNTSSSSSLRTSQTVSPISPISIISSIPISGPLLNTPMLHHSPATSSSSSLRTSEPFSPISPIIVSSVKKVEEKVEEMALPSYSLEAEPLTLPVSEMLESYLQFSSGYLPVYELDLPPSYFDVLTENFADS